MIDKPITLRFQNKLKFGNFGFQGKGKTRVLGEKSLGARTRTNNKLNPHMTSRLGIEPGTHSWEVNALREFCSVFKLKLEHKVLLREIQCVMY